MDLVEHVAADLGIARAKAEKGAGAILAALRMAVARDVFERVKLAVPDCPRLIAQSMAPGGRTGEMPALLGPAGLLAALTAAGFSRAEIPPLGASVLGQLRASAGDAAVDQFLKETPALGD